MLVGTPKKDARRKAGRSVLWRPLGDYCAASGRWPFGLAGCAGPSEVAALALGSNPEAVGFLASVANRIMEMEMVLCA